jgi:hypothetical protein
MEVVNAARMGIFSVTQHRQPSHRHQFGNRRSTIISYRLVNFRGRGRGTDWRSAREGTCGMLLMVAVVKALRGSVMP